MNMSTMSMSVRGCVAQGGKEKDRTEKEGFFVAGSDIEGALSGPCGPKNQQFAEVIFHCTPTSQMYGGMTKTTISLNQDHIQDTDYICEVRMRVASWAMTDGSTGDGVAIC